MANYQMTPLANEAAWQAELECCGNYDIYHSAAYHQLPCEGTPYLFSYKDEFGAAAMPLLLREIPETNYFDFTSVYGYAGIVASLQMSNENAILFRNAFQHAFLQMLDEWKIVSLFSRMNPFILSQWLLEGVADIVELGLTIAIDLRKMAWERRAQMSKGHRYDIRKARLGGVTVIEDGQLERLDDFIEMYNQTMLRKGALPNYFFPREYYLNLKARLGDACRLFLAQRGGKIISGSFFLVADKIMHYHLSASTSDGLNYSGTKLIIDEAAAWGAKQGLLFLNLGGGVGSHSDSLYSFKKGFSSSRHRFSVVKMVCNPAVYRELVRGCEGNDDYFPLYRKSL